MAGYRTIVDPRTGELKRVDESQTATSSQPTPQISLTDEQIAALDSYSREQLKTLITRILCQYGRIAMMSRDETAQAMKDELVRIALRPIVADTDVGAQVRDKLAAIDKWLNREEGTPVQRQITAVGVAAGGFTFADILSALDGKSTGLPVIDGKGSL